MAELLPQEIAKHAGNIRPFVGVHVLESLTSGMYDNPLMVYREYVQNTVDAIDAAVAAGDMRPGAGRLQIHVSGKDRSVTIEDNGCGISPRKAPRILADIGNSAKNGRSQRGFRGIGRLGAIGYCDLLRFETRTGSAEKVAVVEWDAAALRNLLAQDFAPFSLEGAVHRACTARCRRAKTTEPSRFFRVILLNVRPFYDDALMDVATVRDYLSQVAPVPYDASNFSPSQKVCEHLKAVNGFRAYKILVNGLPVLRPYADRVAISTNKAVVIDGVELFEFRTEGGECLARGWYAKTELAGTLPQWAGVRGIRVRQGNIQIGDERLLGDCFGESRFASWHIGEVHITNGHLRPNARRDGFEQSRHYERFLQQAYVLGQHLTHMCRRAAEQRSAARRLSRRMDELEDLVALCALSLGGDSRESLQERTEAILAELETYAKGGGIPRGMVTRLRSARTKVDTLRSASGVDDCLDGRTLRHHTKKKLLEEVSRSIRQFHSTCISAEELIGHVLAPYTKPTAARYLEHLSRRVLWGSGGKRRLGSRP